MSPPGPDAFIVNPAADIRVLTVDEGGPRQIVACAWSATRGFTESVLHRDERAAFAAALDLAAGRDDVLGRLSTDMALTLWHSGLIILPPEQMPPFAPARFAASADAFAADRFVPLRDCLAPEMAARLAAHYRSQVEGGAARLAEGGIDRRYMHNDPAGRVVQRALLPAVEALVGRPLKPSYSYASLYRAGAVLSIHTDRPQCEYTLSLLIDHQPTPPDGVSPWALQIYPRPQAGPVDCFLGVGGGILFCGRDLPHGRQPLPPNETCWTLLLHYVHVDFAGALD